MVGVGTALSGIHIGSAAYIIEQTSGFKSDSQPAGTVITGTAVASAGFMADRSVGSSAERQPIHGYIGGMGRVLR